MAAFAVELFFIILNLNKLAIDQNFTAQQVIGFPSQIVLNDTSTGSDSNVTSRVVYLQTKDNTFLVPSGTTTSYIVWAIANASITIDALNKDYSLVITVNWLDINGATLYTKPLLFGFTLYNETFDYYLTQMLAANNYLITDNNFWPNKSTLRTYIDGGNQAILLASDQGNAQICYDEATKLRVGSQYNFNANA